EDGNITHKAKSGVTDQTLTWNILGQLQQVVGNGVTATYGYDGMGRRVRKTINGVSTWYLYDGDALIMELDGNGNRIRSYSYYPAADRPHSMKQESNGAVYYYVMEEPEHVIGLVNTSNALVNSY